MSDEIRVTVVATGIGRAQPKVMPQPTVVQGGRRDRRSGPFGQSYADLESTSAYSRRQARAVGDGILPTDLGDESFLDIPAFLRRQAD
jgi:hypothetical protein